MTQASYALFETSDGAQICRIPLQVFPKFWAYAYLVKKDGENVLIDTGSGTDTSHEDLLKGFEQAGLQFLSLNFILLTHAHIDHYGGLAKLKPLTNAKIGCHELDVQNVAHHSARLAVTSRRLASFLAETGLAKEEQDQLLSIHRFTSAIYRSVPVDFVYDENFSALEIIHLPGHCPGHVAMRLDDVIFCGDMVVEGVTPHLTPDSIIPYGGLDHYLDSLVRFQEWANGARLILNGHDEAITDLPAQIDSTRKNIIRRIRKALKALGEPRTIAETCKAVYGNASGYNQLLMIEKTGVYIEYLYDHAMIEIVNPDDMEMGNPARYRRLRDIPNSEILPKEKKDVLI